MGRPSSIDARTRAVILYEESWRSQKEICEACGDLREDAEEMAQSIRALRSERTRTEETRAKPSFQLDPGEPRTEIIRLKQRHPSWGARRIKYQYELPCHWRKQEPLGWKTPADIYNDSTHFNKRPRLSEKKTGQ